MKYCVIELVYAYVPIASAPKTRETYGVVIIGKTNNNNRKL